jgi:hypothetical protein
MVLRGGVCRCAVAAVIVLLGVSGTTRAELQQQVELPKLTTQEPIELGTIPEAEVAECKLTVLNATAQSSNAPARGYSCIKENGTWYVRFDPAPGSPLATIRFDKNRLLFQWAADAERSLAGGLRNCVLTVEHGKTVEAVALRTPIRSAAKPLDLSRETNTEAVEVDDLPAVDRFSFEVTGLQGYDGTLTFSPPERRAGLTQPVTIVLNPVPTISLSVQFKATLTKLGSTLSLQVQNHAVAGQGGQARPFTIKEVNTALMKTKTLITNLKSKLAKDEQLYTQLENRLAAMNTPANRNAKQQAAYNAQVGKLQSQLNNDKQKLDQLRIQLPTMENQYEALPVLAKLATDLDGHATIEFRVLYLVEKQFVVLYSTEHAPATPPPPVQNVY